MLVWLLATSMLSISIYALYRHELNKKQVFGKAKKLSYIQNLRG